MANVDKPKKLTELNQLYDEAESVDKEIFAEQRSNVLLIAGEHYSRRAADYFTRLRNTRDNAVEQKLRLTKNHTYRTVRHYVSNILDYAPGTSIVPQRDEEIQDQKSAELYQSVWENYFHVEYKINQIFREACQDYVGIGEVCYKISYDYSQGKVLGYEPLVDEETGEPTLDEMGQPQADETKPQMQGKFIFDRIFAANLLRHPSAKSMRDSPCHIIRHMVDVKDLKAKYAKEPEKLRFIEEGRDDEYIVFDTNRNSYSRTKDQCMLREYYYRPCHEYPEGYFYITTKLGILEEGPLPFGLYPIIWQGFDEYNTSPRARSIVKIVRPYQAEINRAASSMAMAQITLGDDKVIYQAGTKLAPGALLPGVRGVTFQGAPPTVLPGRDGSQYSGYIKDNIMELDQAAMIQEVDIEKNMGVDPTSAYFQTVAQKKRFSLYIQKFEQFMVDFTEICMAMAKQYLPDDIVIPSIGRNEMVNMPEFRSSQALNTLIKVVPREDTMESQLGKQLMIQHALQYTGSQLGKEDIGKLLSNLPYGNFKDTFGDFLIDPENVKSDMLAIERGQMPRLGPYDNNTYYIKKLTHRMKQKDFQFLDPQVQQMYQTFLSQNEQEEARKAQAIKAAESEYIPTSGALIACDMYVPNEEDPTKAPRRVRVPYDALNWLTEKLTAQGSTTEKLALMGNQGALADVANMVSGGAGQSPPGDQNGMSSQTFQQKLAQHFPGMGGSPQ